MRRRTLLSAPLAGLAAACDGTPTWAGGWVGAAEDRGHRLRRPTRDAPVPGRRRRVGVLVVGAGVAGLAAARELARRGIDDVHVLDLEDTAGGNSRAHRIDGQACPLGAHYLPTPAGAVPEVDDLLVELGLAERQAGRVVYDERHLCHAPQERLFIDGQWHEGLLPPIDGDATLRAAYRRCAEAIGAAARLGFAIPTARAPWTDAHAALDAQPFAAWLDAAGLVHPRLRWYLDYCCRDDYGAGIEQVSAWAGLQYFASRHGFHAPEDDAPAEPVLTWPEGNAWLTRRLAEPLSGRLHLGRLAWRVGTDGAHVAVDVWDATEGGDERWLARQVVLAVPLFVAARLVDDPVLRSAAAALPSAPWLVANLQLAEPLAERHGAAPAWDNVLYDERPGAPGLGYVDAQHQSLVPVRSAGLITAYWALGGRDRASLQAARRALHERPWRDWAGDVVADLRRAHPDLPRKLRRIDLMRYGHAMAVPVPGVRSHPALAALAAARGPLHYAHADLSGYSIFEEAYLHGLRAAARVIEHERRTLPAVRAGVSQAGCLHPSPPWPT